MTSGPRLAIIHHVDATTAQAGRDAVVGREAELDRIHAFLGRREGLPAGLLILGPAGAGKTTIWRAGVGAADAAGFLVLSCRPAGAEVRLSHAALADLLEAHLGGVLPGLPRPQRRALEIALLLDDDGGPAPDRRAISAGALSAVRALAREQPVLIAIDDAQWVDGPSTEVLEFLMRRLGDAPVAILASRRTSSPTASTAGPPTGVRPERALERPVSRLEVGPLSLGAMTRVLRARAAVDFNRRTLQRIHETSAGNPFYALELARALEAVGGRLAQGEPLTLGADLGHLLAERMVGLADQTRDALFIAAAVSQPSITRVAAAMRASNELVERVFADAARAQVVRVRDGRIEFVHPLLAAAAYGAIEPEARRTWHARIAETATDAESAARHVAMARPGPDAGVARKLADAARAARDRGAPTAAAELFLQALATLPDDSQADRASQARRAELVAEAAPVLIATGQADTARGLLEAAVGTVGAGLLRSDLKLLLARLVDNDEAGLLSQTRLLDEALEEAAGDPARSAAVLLDREQVERARDRSPDALPLALRALDFAGESGDERLLARAHVRSADLEVVLGMVADPVARFQRALELGERVPVDAENSARSMLAVCLIRAGRLDEARPHLAAERVRSIAEGDEPSFCWTSLFLGELEWFAGRWDAAAACTLEALEVAEQTGLRLRMGGLQALLGLVEASRGNPVRARTLLGEAIATLDAVEEVAYGNYARQMLAFLDLSEGNATAARAVLGTYPAGRLEGSKRLAFIGDQIEALVALGEVERAANLASELAGRGLELHRPPLVATAARCRALILGARGDLDGAGAAAREAVAGHGELGLPFDRARSLLVLGEVQRRAKQRRAARESLTAAIEAFKELGAHLWVLRAEAERARIGGRSSIEGLSETELRVAQLVAEGRTNKEVAAELFVTVRAVEANLSKVYAKLGIASRTELARRL